ncbi:hypothetical protein VTK26DRAFT_7350 [Humicola hyalothermophila]
MRLPALIAAASAHLASAELLATADWMGQPPEWPGKRDVHPRETGRSAVDEVHGWSPRPTEAPFLVDGADPMEVARRRDEWIRVKRQDEEDISTWLNAHTCGYRADLSSSAFICESPSTCATSGSVVACSSRGMDSNPFFRVCLDYQASLRGACNSADTETGCCGSSTAPACITYLWPGSTQKYMYRCFRTQTIYTMLSAPQFVIDAATRTTSTSSSSSTSESTTSDEPTQEPTSPPRNGDDDEDDSGSNNTGAIVGGTIGGVAGLALIAGTIAFFIIRKRNQQNQSGSPSQPVAHSAVTPGDTSYPGGGGGGGGYPPQGAPSPQMSQFSPAPPGGAASLHPPSSYGQQPGSPSPYTTTGTPFNTASNPYSTSATPPVPGAYDMQQQQQHHHQQQHNYPQRQPNHPQQYYPGDPHGVAGVPYKPYPGPGYGAPGAPAPQEMPTTEQSWPAVEMPTDSMGQR